MDPTAPPDPITPELSDEMLAKLDAASAAWLEEEHGGGLRVLVMLQDRPSPELGRRLAALGVTVFDSRVLPAVVDRAALVGLAAVAEVQSITADNERLEPVSV